MTAEVDIGCFELEHGQARMRGDRSSVESRTPPRMSAPEISKRVLSPSPSSQAAATAVTIGTQSWMMAAVHVAKLGSAAYQSVYAMPDVSAPETIAITTPRGVSCTRWRVKTHTTSAIGTV